VKLALIGDPVAHSHSPALHAEFLDRAGIAGTYSSILVPRGDGVAAIRRLADEAYDGCNVTFPLKEEALVACEQLTDEARRARAVNTIAFGRTIVGTNTDGIGARIALEAALEQPLALNRVGVLGYGATARAILAELHDNDVYTFVWGRNSERTHSVCEEFEAVPWVVEEPPEFVISTLPPEAEIPKWLAAQLLTVDSILDANYGERATLGARLGREVLTGEAMLRSQAHASFDFWLTSMQDASSSNADELRDI
jgi:shikimate dehydrogenase